MCLCPYDFVLTTVKQLTFMTDGNKFCKKDVKHYFLNIRYLIHVYRMILVSRTMKDEFQ